MNLAQAKKSYVIPTSYVCPCQIHRKIFFEKHSAHFFCDNIETKYERNMQKNQCVAFFNVVFGTVFFKYLTYEILGPQSRVNKNFTKDEKIG